jgi:hypothetical protein
MGKEQQLSVHRGRVGARRGRLAETTTTNCAAEESIRPHPLSILALASSIRLDDPKLEQERVVMLEVAIVAGRDAAHALDRWLSQSLTEYRGSRSAWDLKATTVEMRMKLRRFEETVRDSADRLVVLAPQLLEAVPGYVPSAQLMSGRRRILDEVAVAASLLASIDCRPTDQTVIQRSSASTA